MVAYFKQMKVRKFWLTLLLTGEIFAAGCKQNPEKTSHELFDSSTAVQEKEIPDSCACDDLKCWEARTNDGIEQQLDCVKSAITSAAILSSGGLSGTIQAVSALSSMKDALADQNLSALFSASGWFALNAVETLGKEGVPVVECLKSSATITMEFFSVLDRLKEANIQDVNSLTNIILALGEGFDGVNNIGKSLIYCTKIAKTLPSNPHLLAFTKFTQGFSDLLWTVEGLYSVAKCGVQITNGGKIIFQNSICLAADLKKINLQKRQIQTALAHNGSRLVNHARLTGCQCLTSGYFSSADEDLSKCNACCNTSSGSVLNPNESKKKATWLTQCNLSCNIAKTNGMFSDYTDMKTCNEVTKRSKMEPDLMVYRYISLNDGMPASLEIARRKKAEFADAVRVLITNYQSIDGACKNESADGSISNREIHCCTESASSMQLKNSCLLVTVQESTNRYYELLDTASGRPADSLVNLPELKAFARELESYWDEAEAN